MSKPKLNKSMKAAGLVSIGSRNLNGSYTCRVKIAHIDVGSSDINYRAYDAKHTNELERDYYELAMRNPILMYVPRRYKMPTIDARHTVHLLLRRNSKAQENGENPPHSIVECDVFFGLKKEQAAKIFYYLTQKSKRMDPWSAFYAAQEAKFDFAVKITQLLKEFEFTTPIDDGVPPSQKADITSAEPLTQAWFKYGGESMVHNLFTLLKAFVDGDGYLDPVAGTSGFMRGLMDLLRMYPDYDASQLAIWLGRQDAQFFKSLAHDISNRENKRLDRKHYRGAFEVVIPSRFKIAA